MLCEMTGGQAYNGTTVTPPPTFKLGAVMLQNLLQIHGDGAGPTGPPTRPAANISVRGLGFRDAGYTYAIRDLFPSCSTALPPYCPACSVHVGKAHC